MSSRLPTFLVPQPLRKALARARHARLERSARAQVLDYFTERPAERSAFEHELRYLAAHRFHAFPYDFVQEYDVHNIEVLRDGQCGLLYVMHRGARLYFPRAMTVREVKKYFAGILVEQDARSPHCYLDETFRCPPGSVIADVGAAEGIFSLEQIESARHCHLFEPDSKWVEPLQHTFAPWNSKVTIVQKFVTDTTGPQKTTIDAHFDSSRVDFLKIDAEGDEPRVLQGASASLRNTVSHVAVCCYHRVRHHNELSALLTSMGYDVAVTGGYALFFTDPQWAPPFFRPALLRARADRERTAWH